jgi:uncharacterized repeat protein (TIGR02543 family)
MNRLRYISLIILVIFAFTLAGCEDATELGENEVRVKVSASSLVGTHYEDVVEQLEVWGFTNIETEAVYDIIWGITKEGTTKSVKIGGSESFSSGDIYDKDVSILVKYSMKASSDPSKQTFDITWKNEDGTTLKTDKVTFGNMPSYNGSIPTKVAVEEKKYEFSGWTPELEPATENKTYTATFIEVENRFTVSYNLEGGQWDLDNTQSIIYNGLITASIPSKEGYDFAGWVIKGFWSDTKFDSSTNVKQDYNLSATWTASKFTVSYDLDGGVWSRSNDQSLNYNDKITTTKPTKDGHNFMGWLFDGSLFDVNTPVKSNIVLKALWELPNYEDILVGRWEGVYESSKAYGFSFIEFDGYFHDSDGHRTSGLRDFDYNWGSFTLYGNKIGINYIDAGTVYFTISYNNDTERITLKNSNYPDIVLRKTEDEPNSLAWKWNHLYEFAKTRSESKIDEYGLYYEIEMSLETSNLSPINKQVETTRQIMKVYQDKLIDMYFYYKGINDPNIEMIVNVAFDYKLISNNRITNVYISIKSEGYTMVTNKAVVDFEFDEYNEFWFTISNLAENGNNFPISSNNVLLDLEYFGRTVLFNYADFLLKEHEIYMFTK